MSKASSPAKLKLAAKKIYALYRALQVLAGRGLPSVDARYKVVNLLKHFESTFDKVEAARKGVIADHYSEPGASSALALQKALDAMWAKEFTVDDPADRLKPSDMPKVREDKPDNADGLAAVEMDLDIVFARE